MVAPKKRGKSANAILDCYGVLAVANENGTLRGHHTGFSRTKFGSRREGSSHLHFITLTFIPSYYKIHPRSCISGPEVAHAILLFLYNTVLLGPVDLPEEREVQFTQEDLTSNDFQYYYYFYYCSAWQL